VLGRCRTEAGRLPAAVPSSTDHYGGTGDTMSWTAELPIVWIIDGRRVPGRVAIGVPVLVPDGDGEAICPVALDGLQSVTPVRGEGEFHALLQGVHFLDLRLRHYVADGVRAVFPGEVEEPDVEEPERDTASLLAMFKPLDSR
jgi:hypothetical protein